MENEGVLSHDTLDRLVSTVLGFFERAFSAIAPNPTFDNLNDVAFSDEWERQQIARELHWN